MTIGSSFISKYSLNYCSRSYFSNKLKSPPITHITGDEYSRYACDLYLKNWVQPHLDTSSWETFDFGTQNRIATKDRIIYEAIESGKRTCSIFKEPTLTLNEAQIVPNANTLLREGWNGTSISRDTIHIPGVSLGYKNKVLFDRHAIGGEYYAGYELVGSGKLVTKYLNDSGKSQIVDERVLDDDLNAVVTYHNPYDNVPIMARHFFSRCLDAKVTPYIVTKKTVFKWQEPFWQCMLDIFNNEYKSAFNNAGLLKECRGELNHLLSDVATMRIVRWSNGGFGMCSLNYDGDVLTDEIAQVHRSTGFLTSVLNGSLPDGTTIKKFETSHGTNTSMWKEKQRGKETSFNPLSLIEALLGAIEFSVEKNPTYDIVLQLTSNIRKAVHQQIGEEGKATRDISGPKGLNTEEFVEEVKNRISKFEQEQRQLRERGLQLDRMRYDNQLMRRVFVESDKDGDGHLDFNDFQALMKKLGAAPVLKRKSSHL